MSNGPREISMKKLGGQGSGCTNRKLMPKVTYSYPSMTYSDPKMAYSRGPTININFEKVMLQ